MSFTAVLKRNTQILEPIFLGVGRFLHGMITVQCFNFVCISLTQKDYSEVVEGQRKQLVGVCTI